MVGDENVVHECDAAEGSEDDNTRANEVDDDSESVDEEADEGTLEEEKDTEVDEVEDTVGGDACEEDGRFGSNDEDDEGTEEEDDDDGSNGEDSEGTEEEDDEVDSNDKDREGTEEEDDESESSGEDNEGTEEEDNEGGSGYKNDEGLEGEEDPSEYVHAHLTARKKREFEIFVSRLDKKTVEDDLREVFAPFGKIEAVRIVKHPVTQKSKGFAFIRYAAAEQAKKALAELKDGAEVVHCNLLNTFSYSLVS